MVLSVVQLFEAIPVWTKVMIPRGGEADWGSVPSPPVKA